MPSLRPLDPFTVEVIKNSLTAAAEEMFWALGRTSQSPVIYEVLDYACGITDAKARLIAEANGLPGFLGTLTFAVEDVVEKFGTCGLAPGDIIVMNTPYGGGGSHLSDVVLVAPIFYRRQPVAFAVNKAHWTEIGGKDPGSWTTDSSDLFQEGLHLPCTKIFDLGKEIPSVVDIIRANSRLPEQTLGDMRAQAASLHVAGRRVVGICRKYGLEAFLAAVDEIIQWGERTTRELLKRLPKGTFQVEELMDTYGIQREPVKLKATVSISREGFRVDFTGTGPAVLGPVNTAFPMLKSACRTMIKAVTDPHLHANEGCFAPLEVLAPAGTVFTAQPPSPTATYWEAAGYAEDLVWKALAPYLPDRLTAGHFLSVCATIVGGAGDERTLPWLLVEPQAGGWGAGSNKDGESGLVCSIDGETYIMPVEIQETRYPILVEQFSLDTKEGGVGRRRGGFGLIRDYRILCERAFATLIFGRSSYPPWGVGGGGEGTGNYIEIHSKRKVVRTNRVTVHPLEKGDLLRMVTGMGGGYGDPLLREPELVLNDVRDGLVSFEFARQGYGVVIDPQRMVVDIVATTELRHNLRMTRRSS